MKDKFPDHARKVFVEKFKIKRLSTLYNGRTLTQYDVGKYLGYETGSQVSLWEKGERLPIDVEIIKKFAQLCHCSREETKELIKAYEDAIKESHGL